MKNSFGNCLHVGLREAAKKLASARRKLSGDSSVTVESAGCSLGELNSNKHQRTNLMLERHQSKSKNTSFFSVIKRLTYLLLGCLDFYLDDKSRPSFCKLF